MSSMTSSSTLEKKLRHYRLNRAEYDCMKQYLEHEPSDIEWAVYSALWSEHCSYKSSKVHLKQLFTKHERVVQGPGENAGVIDLGQGERVAFKMESHNHPSFIEPMQGAATGVGGILRDIFTMGARPMASMDFLCFGDLGHSLTPRLLSGVVAGIGGYGNCVGVPTVSGQTTFHPRYNQNILVNAFNLGLFRPGQEVFYGRAQGVGNLVVYAGSATGRDGVHGAAMASESFGSRVESKKVNVQIGDPFFEKLLIEACLEVMNRKLVVGIQDMGAAGLTSSTFEMASRAKSGLRLDLKKIPLREPDITPEEILLSESQERMILIVKPENLSEVVGIFERWGLNGVAIGEIVDGEHVELWWGSEQLAKISHIPLVEGAPVYHRPFQEPSSRGCEPVDVVVPKDLNQVFQKFLSHPSLCSREAIGWRYDQRVGAKTIAGCGSEVTLLRLPDSKRVLGMALGCRPLLMEWDCRWGATDSVALPVLQLAAKGVKALALTDCLNFGNPEREDIMGEFVASLKALNKTALLFDTPIISGNVSLYNETNGQSIVGAPAVGVVGLCERVLSDGQSFWLNGKLEKTGLKLFLVKNLSESLLLLQYLRAIEGKPPQGEVCLVERELLDLQKVFLELSQHACNSKVIGLGGLATALFRLSSSTVGVKVDYQEKDRNAVELLFGERFYAAVWAVDTQRVEAFRATCQRYAGKISWDEIGESVPSVFEVNDDLKCDLSQLHGSWHGGVGKILEEMA